MNSERDDRHDQAGGAPRRLQQQHDEDHAEHDVEPVRHRGAVGEILAAPERVGEDRDRGGGGDHVPPADAVAKARRDREQQKASTITNADMGVAQRLRRHDVVGGIEVKQRHRHRDRGDDVARRSRQPVGGALLRLRRTPRPCAVPRRKWRPARSGGCRAAGRAVARCPAPCVPSGFLRRTLAQARRRANHLRG